MIAALTFDDGPNTVITPQVLDLLEEHGIVASFFLIADRITEESAQVVKRAKAMGCEINNHTKSHGFMDKMTPEQIRYEVDYCTDRIVEITGEKPRFFRPPFIAVSRTMFDEIDLPFICGVGCEDWVPAVSAEERAKRILSAVKDGDLLLLHDMLYNENTVEALRTVIPEMKKRGFRFATCSGIFAEKGVTPVRNRMYSNVFDAKDWEPA